MEKFEIPLSGGRVDNSNSKELVISSYMGNLVRSPYNGVVKDVDVNRCGGHIKIEHNVNGQKCYSSFCEVNRITVNKGDTIRKGNSIGIMGDKDITYSILNDSGKKINTKPFFSGIDTSTNDKDDSEKNTKSDNNKNKTDNNKNKTDDNTSSIGKGQDIFTAIGLAPFNLVDKLIGDKFKAGPLYRESILKDKVLREELKRIKRLL
jgi:hypothetical protein